MVLLLWQLFIKKIAFGHKNQAVNLHQMYSMRLLILSFLLVHGVKFNVSYGQQRSTGTIDRFFTRKFTSVIPQDLSYQQSGIMCKKECQLQNVLKANVFLRLGSKEYVDRMERKPNSFVGRKD